MDRSSPLVISTTFAVGVTCAILGYLIGSRSQNNKQNNGFKRDCIGTGSNLSTSSIGKMNIDMLLAKVDLRGKKVLVRADLNVPRNSVREQVDRKTGVIADDTRLRESVPTLRKLIDAGAKVILVSHFGRPEAREEELRMAPVAVRLGELLNQLVHYYGDQIVGYDIQEIIDDLKPGSIVLLENVRFDARETDNDDEFSQKLAALSDGIFVNDAFGTAHRAHSSTVGITRYMKYSVAGLLMEKELRYLSAAVNHPARPLAAVIGGAKVSTKIPVIESLINKCDIILIGGGMAFTFLKSMGYNVGDSLVENDFLELASKLLLLAQEKRVKIMLPSDVVVADKFASDAAMKIVDINMITDGWMGLDIGPRTISEYDTALSHCQTIVWNGPMGVFEFPRFAEGTRSIGQSIAKLTGFGVTTIVGGGDSVAAVEKFGYQNSMTHISTGGGASLELLEGKVLPGVAALTDDDETRRLKREAIVRQQQDEIKSLKSQISALQIGNNTDLK